MFHNTSKFIVSWMSLNNWQRTLRNNKLNIFILQHQTKKQKEEIFEMNHSIRIEFNKKETKIEITSNDPNDFEWKNLFNSFI